MTLDDVAQKIYEERYTDPKDPSVSAYMRDMIREIAARAIELTIGVAATDVVVATVAPLVASRRERNEAHEAVVAWMKEAAARGELAQPGQAPAWPAYRRSEEAWHDAVTKLDAATCERNPE